MAMNRTLLSDRTCRWWLTLFDFSDVGSIGTPLTLPSIQVRNIYSFSDNLTVTHGKHSLKVGAEIRREQFTILQPVAPFLCSENEERGAEQYLPIFASYTGWLEK
jgi:hypothetical protein